MDWQNIRDRITASGIDRRELATAMLLSYPALSNRIYGYTPWSEEELQRLDTILAVAGTV